MKRLKIFKSIAQQGHLYFGIFYPKYTGVEDEQVFTLAAVSPKSR